MLPCVVLLLLLLVVFVSTALLRSLLVLLVLAIVSGVTSSGFTLFTHVGEASCLWVIVLERMDVKLHMFDESLFVLLTTNLGKFEQNWDHTESIKSCVMLLTQPKWTLLPIGHLLTLADFSVQHLLGNLG